jgi:hypothetical protein
MGRGGASLKLARGFFLFFDFLALARGFSKGR